MYGTDTNKIKGVKNENSNGSFIKFRNGERIRKRPFIYIDSKTTASGHKKNLK
ncbi:hypothetical protein GCM10011418_25810 [Sphingobacterium alkalisoli]|nr:hypothetical protein GCM10011418_25810 [Sphingobacterium alkalisoli]